MQQTITVTQETYNHEAFLKCLSDIQANSSDPKSSVFQTALNALEGHVSAWEKMSNRGSDAYNQCINNAISAARDISVLSKESKHSIEVKNIAYLIGAIAFTVLFVGMAVAGALTMSVFPLGMLLMIFGTLGAGVGLGFVLDAFAHVSGSCDPLKRRANELEQILDALSKIQKDTEKMWWLRNDANVVVGQVVEPKSV